MFQSTILLELGYLVLGWSDGGKLMGAAAAVCIREGKLLMVLQGKPEDDKTWSVPSGQIEFGECYEDCCKRGPGRDRVHRFGQEAGSHQMRW